MMLYCSLELLAYGKEHLKGQGFFNEYRGLLSFLVGLLCRRVENSPGSLAGIVFCRK